MLGGAVHRQVLLPGPRRGGGNAQRLTGTQPIGTIQLEIDGLELRLRNDF